MEEVWKDIKEYGDETYDGEYEVSNLGNIYSHHIGRNLRAGTSKSGHKYVILRKNGNSKYALVHRLVAQAFIPNPDNLPAINHKDEDPSNNNVDNLEWCTYYYNNVYNDVHLKRGKQLSKVVYAYDENGDLVGVYSSTNEVGKYFNMSHGNVSTACNSDYKTFNNLILSYVELSKEEVLSRFKENKIRKNISENIGEYIRQTKSKAVNQYDLDGNFIKSYYSTQEAGRQLGFSPSLIAGVCRGEHKYTHGFIFKYVD